MRSARRLDLIAYCRGLTVAAVLASQWLPMQALAEKPPESASPPPAMLLVASPKLADPRFKQSVILVLRHGRGGPLGVIINQRLEIPLTQVFPERSDPALEHQRLHFGGPVSPGQLIYIYRHATAQPRSALPVAPELWMSQSLNLLKQLLDTPPPAMKVMRGFAAWARGQLEHEITRGDWFLMPLDGVLNASELLFGQDTETLWQTLIKRASERQAQGPVPRLPADVISTLPKPTPHTPLLPDTSGITTLLPVPSLEPA